MPKNYQLTSDARSDLIKIRQYTLQHWGTEQSTKYLAKLRQAIELLAENTSIGKLRPEVAKKVYSFPHASHVIYYIVEYHYVRKAEFRFQHRRQRHIEILKD